MITLAQLLVYMLVGGGLLGTIAVIAVKDKDTRKRLGYWGLGIFMAGLVMTAFIPAATKNKVISELFAAPEVPKGEEEVAPVYGVVCPDYTTVTLSATNFYTAVATGGGHKYSLNGAPALSIADGNTFRASPNDVLDILFYNASATGSYFSSVKKVVVPCKGTATFSDRLYQNGTIALSVWNEEGVLISADDNVNETVINGDMPTLKAELRGQYQRGAPYGAVAVADYNSTTFDNVVLDFGGAATDVPDMHSSTTGMSSKAYTVPAILSSTIYPVSITLDADDANDPTSVGSDITVTVYTNNYFVNELNRGAFEGPATEDEDDVATGLQKYVYTIHID